MNILFLIISAGVTTALYLNIFWEKMYFVIIIFCSRNNFHDFICLLNSFSRLVINIFEKYFFN